MLRLIPGQARPTAASACLPTVHGVSGPWNDSGSISCPCTCSPHLDVKKHMLRTVLQLLSPQLSLLGSRKRQAVVRKFCKLLSQCKLADLDCPCAIPALFTATDHKPCSAASVDPSPAPPLTNAPGADTLRALMPRSVRAVPALEPQQPCGLLAARPAQQVGQTMWERTDGALPCALQLGALGAGCWRTLPPCRWSQARPLRAAVLWS